MDSDNAEVIERYLGPYKRGQGTARNVKVRGSQKLASLTAQGRELTEYRNLNMEDITFLANRYREDLHHFGYNWTLKNFTGRPTLHTNCVNGGYKKQCC